MVPDQELKASEQPGHAQAGEFSLRQFCEVTPTYGRAPITYYLGNLEETIKPLRMSIINLLNKDNDIDFARLWWGLMSDKKIFNHLPTFLLF